MARSLRHHVARRTVGMYQVIYLPAQVALPFPGHGTLVLAELNFNVSIANKDNLAGLRGGLNNFRADPPLARGHAVDIAGMRAPLPPQDDFLPALQRVDGLGVGECLNEVLWFEEKARLATHPRPPITSTHPPPTFLSSTVESPQANSA